MVAPNARAILEAAMKLPVEERASLAEEIWISVDPASQAEIDAAWDREVEKRLEALDRGEITPIDGEPILRALKEGRIP